MSGPVVINVQPEDASIGVPISVVASLWFDRPLDPTTVTPLTIILADVSNGYQAIPVGLTYNAEQRRVLISPNQYLNPQNLYEISVIGFESSQIHGGAVRDIDGIPMEQTASYLFTTGTGAETSPPDPSSVVPPPQPEPSDAFEPTDTLQVNKTIPKDYASNVPTTLPYIVVQFNKATNIQNGELGEDLIGIDDTADYQTRLDYFVQVTGRHILYATPGYATTDPGWEVMEDGRVLYITPSDQLPENMEYTIKLQAGLPGLSSFPLAEDFESFFTTEMNPLYTTPEVIRVNPVGPLIQDIPDDTINRLIYEHSVEASSMYPGEIGEDVPYYVHMFVTCSVKLDLLYSYLASAATRAGGSKRLGDMSIEYGDSDPTKPVRELMDDLRKCKQNNKLKVQSGGDPTNMRVTVKSQTDPRRPITDDSWRRLGVAGEFMFHGNRDRRPDSATGLGF